MNLNTNLCTFKTHRFSNYPETITEFNNYLEKKYLYIPIIENIKEYILFDIDIFCDNLIENNVCNKIFVDDLKIHLKKNLILR